MAKSFLEHDPLRGLGLTSTQDKKTFVNKLYNLQSAHLLRKDSPPTINPRRGTESGPIRDAATPSPAPRTRSLVTSPKKENKDANLGREGGAAIVLSREPPPLSVKTTIVERHDEETPRQIPKPQHHIHNVCRERGGRGGGSGGSSGSGKRSRSGLGEKLKEMVKRSASGSARREATKNTTIVIWHNLIDPRILDSTPLGIDGTTTASDAVQSLLDRHDCTEDPSLFYLVVRDASVDDLEAPLGCFDCPAGVQEHWPAEHSYRFELRQAEGSLIRVTCHVNASTKTLSFPVSPGSRGEDVLTIALRKLRMRNVESSVFALLEVGEDGAVIGEFDAARQIGAVGRGVFRLCPRDTLGSFLGDAQSLVEDSGDEFDFDGLLGDRKSAASIVDEDLTPKFERLSSMEADMAQIERSLLTDGREEEEEDQDLRRRFDNISTPLSTPSPLRNPASLENRISFLPKRSPPSGRAASPVAARRRIDAGGVSSTTSPPSQRSTWQRHSATAPPSLLPPDGAERSAEDRPNAVSESSVYAGESTREMALMKSALEEKDKRLQQLMEMATQLEDLNGALRRKDEAAEEMRRRLEEAERLKAEAISSRGRGNRHTLTLRRILSIRDSEIEIDDAHQTLESVSLNPDQIPQFLVRKDVDEPLRVAHVKEGLPLRKRDAILEADGRPVWNCDEIEFGRIVKNLDEDGERTETTVDAAKTLHLVVMRKKEAMGLEKEELRLELGAMKEDFEMLIFELDAMNNENEQLRLQTERLQNAEKQWTKEKAELLHKLRMLQSKMQVRDPKSPTATPSKASTSRSNEIQGHSSKTNGCDRGSAVVKRMGLRRARSEAVDGTSTMLKQALNEMEEEEWC